MLVANETPSPSAAADAASPAGSTTPELPTLAFAADAPAPTPEERLARIEDRFALEELLAHYARCVDEQDAAGVAAAFTADGRLETIGNPAIAGRERIAKLYGRLLGEISASSHLLGTVQVHFPTHEGAVAACTFLAWDSYVAQSRPDELSHGRYEASAVREPDGLWRLAALRICFAAQMHAEFPLLEGAAQAQLAKRPWPPQFEL